MFWLFSRTKWFNFKILAKEQKMPELSYRANVFPIWCKIILFTHFKFELLSYRAMKTIKLSCYLQKFGFSKQTRTRSKNEKTKKNYFSNKTSWKRWFNEPIDDKGSNFRNRIRKVWIRFLFRTQFMNK